jgi:ubiquinone/menaquinone biosynthesis C-methylase UbiE
MRLSLRQRWRHLSGRVVFAIGARFYAWMTWDRTFRGHCASMADHFPARSGLAVLDVGIGPGISGIGILDRRPDVRVVGLDFARAMLRQARRYLGRAGCAVDLVRADVTHLPFADGSFDVVTHHSFLYLLAHREAALDEMARVLRPGGAYVILEPSQRGTLGPTLRGAGSFRFKLSMVLWRLFSRGYGRFSAEELAALLTRHGFCDITVEPTLSGLGLLVRARRA